MTPLRERLWFPKEPGPCSAQEEGLGGLLLAPGSLPSPTARLELEPRWWWEAMVVGAS